jgi:hypothetical protein
MWQLTMTNTAKEWIEVGTFETVTVAASRIRELEGYPTTGVFFEAHFDTVLGTTRKLAVFFITRAAVRSTASGVG